MWNSRKYTAMAVVGVGLAVAAATPASAQLLGSGGAYGYTGGCGAYGYAPVYGSAGGCGGYGAYGYAPVSGYAGGCGGYGAYGYAPNYGFAGACRARRHHGYGGYALARVTPRPHAYTAYASRPSVKQTMQVVDR